MGDFKEDAKHLKLSPPPPSSPPPPEEQSSNVCDICFEEWTTHGSHRLCSLECGHFFGRSCVLRWIEGQGKKHCPMCNRKAKEKDVRNHFATSKALAAKDGTKEENLKRELMDERQARVGVEMSFGRMKVQMESQKSRAEAFKEEIYAIKANIAALRPVVMVAKMQPVVQAVTGNKVYDLPLLVANMPRPKMFKWISDEFGGIASTQRPDDLKSFCLGLVHPDFPNRDPMFLGGGGGPAAHRLMIRDVTFENEPGSFCYGGTVASASLDGTVKLYSVANKNYICTFDIGEPVWSVAYGQNASVLFAGTARGRVLCLDPRNTSRPLACCLQTNEPIQILSCPSGDHSWASSATDLLCAASFTNVHLIQRKSSSSEFFSMPITKLPVRCPGGQYGSVEWTHPTARGVKALAISVRGSDSFVELGTINECEFSSRIIYRGAHGRPSGKIGCFGLDAIAVPDDASKSCVVYPNGDVIKRVFDSAGVQPPLISGAWYCGRRDLCALISGDVVEFVDPTQAGILVQPLEIVQQQVQQQVQPAQLAQ